MAASRRTIRSNALEKLARLSAQSPSPATTSADYMRFFKRCPNASAAYIGAEGEDYGIQKTWTPMVRVVGYCLETTGGGLQSGQPS